MKKLICIISLFYIALAFATPLENSIIGKWRLLEINDITARSRMRPDEHSMLVFNQDGTYEENSQSGTLRGNWKMENGTKLMLRTPNENQMTDIRQLTEETLVVIIHGMHDIEKKYARIK